MANGLARMRRARSNAGRPIDRSIDPSSGIRGAYLSRCATVPCECTRGRWRPLRANNTRSSFSFFFSFFFLREVSRIVPRFLVTGMFRWSSLDSVLDLLRGNIRGETFRMAEAPLKR